MRGYIATALLLQAVATNAVAQTSVQIFGSVDNGITYVNNYGGSSKVMLQDGMNKSNSLGFIGSEDLGGGKSAIFKLENGFSLNNGAMGQGGLMFGKQAWVGLADRDTGQIMLGRQYDYTVLLEQYLPCLNCGLYGVQNADFDRVSGERLNNTVSVRSANFAGFTLSGMYAFGQNSGAFSTNLGRAISAAVQYTNGPFTMGAVYTDINRAPIFAGLAGAPEVLGVAITSPAQTLYADNQRIFGIGAAYRFANARLAALYTNTRMTLGARSDTDQVLHVGIDYSLRSNLNLMGKVSADRFAGSRWYSVNAGVDYLLSKRTDVYVDLGAQRATGAGTVASIALTAPSSTNTQFVSRVGIRHLF